MAHMEALRSARGDSIAPLVACEPRWISHTKSAWATSHVGGLLWSDLRSTGGDSEVVSDGDGKRSKYDGDVTLFTCGYHLARSATRIQR